MAKRTETKSNKTTSYDSVNEMDADVRNPSPVKRTKGQSETERLQNKAANTGENGKKYPVSKGVNSTD